MDFFQGYEEVKVRVKVRVVGLPRKEIMMISDHLGATLMMIEVLLQVGLHRLMVVEIAMPPRVVVVAAEMVVSYVEIFKKEDIV